MSDDLRIAQAHPPQALWPLAQQLGIPTDHYEPYGHYKAKLSLDTAAENPEGKLILVSALSPTPPGEGKTTTSIGLLDGLCRIGKKAIAVLREPSLGPVFGMKGGATGGGYAQVQPMEDINLHFTGDFAAVEKAHNLLAALIDNALHQKKNPLPLDPRTVVWKRVVDLNDRSLRKIVTGLGGTGMGIPRESGFDITAASEIMAILCLATDLPDLKKRLGAIFVGYSFDRKPVFARDLKAEGAMAALLKDAIKPNLVQTLEANPVLMHGGPFANIAQGTNTVIATRMGLRLADYTVTEAGFGFDLGGEKFLDIKCPGGDLKPELVVMVATLRAIKYHGGAEKPSAPNMQALEKGFANLQQHLANAAKFGLPALVALNHFADDPAEELEWFRKKCEDEGYNLAQNRSWSEGGKGAEEMASKVVEVLANNKAHYRPLYTAEDSIRAKIETVAHEVYRAGAVDWSAKALKQLKQINDLTDKPLRVCIAKTQYSFSDNPKLLGAPRDFSINIRELELSHGAGFVVAITGDIMRMPGLPLQPAADGIDIDAEGRIKGLF